MDYLLNVVVPCFPPFALFWLNFAQGVHASDREHMLDINGFRVEYGGNPEVVRESQRRREADETLVDKVVASDSAWRVAGHTLQKLQGELSKAKAAAHAARKEQQVDEAKRLLDRVKALSVEVAAAAGVEATAQLDARRHLAAVSNLVHEHAPVRADEEELRPRPAGLHAAARRLIDAGLAEACGSGSWRPAGRGVLLREQALRRTRSSCALWLYLLWLCAFTHHDRRCAAR